MDSNRQEISITTSSNSFKHVVGRPTKYSEEMLIRANNYYLDCRAGKIPIPFIEELAIILDVNGDTVVEWAKKTNIDGELVYPEFSATIKKLKNFQKLRLLQRCLTRYNPAGAIFLLKTVHGMVEEEKRINLGKSRGLLQIEIVEEKNTNLTNIK